MANFAELFEILAFRAVHSGEHCGSWASGFRIVKIILVYLFFLFSEVDWRKIENIFSYCGRFTALSNTLLNMMYEKLKIRIGTIGTNVFGILYSVIS